MRRFPLRRGRSWLLALLAGVWLALQGGVPLQAVSMQAPPPVSSATASAVIPIERQPFYGDLELTARSWSDVVLDQVVGDSPRDTLLNFYAVMAEVGRRSDLLARQRLLNPGQGAAAGDRREQIADTELLFHLAVKALDASAFPESVRVDRAEEAAIQLKHVLDYVFTHSRQPIQIPDAAGMKAINDNRTKPSDSWHIPGTSIDLTSSIASDPDQSDFLFSAQTVAAVEQMYREIRGYPVVDQPFATPEFFNDFIYTPGYLVPPDWYLAWPPSLRRLIEVPIEDQTLFQIACATVAFVVYLAVLGWLTRLLFATYRDPRESEPSGGVVWGQDALAWRRFLITLPMLPLTRVVKTFVDDVVNFTGFPLTVVTYIFNIVWYVTAGLLVFYVFEAIGRSSAEMMARVRGGGSSLQLQRITNFVMPLCRAIGALAAVVLGYRLLIVLGLPSNTVLAFSAVPGLAIGLGASKLLGNLFAGLSIQTDRPLRVGEFCRVGDNLGYITKIGLRSLELETLESRVTIPNSVADEATIINYSRRDRRGDQTPMQGLEVRIPLDEDFTPYQLEELLYQSRRFLAGLPDLQEPLVTLEHRAEETSAALIVFAMVELHGWQAYLALREQLLVHLEELVERAHFSSLTIGVSYAATPEQLQRIPALMQEVVEQDSNLEFHACRLEQIGSFSYDHELEFRSHHLQHDAFEDSLHELNRRIIEVLAQHGIEIPFPTQTLMITPSDATHP